MPLTVFSLFYHQILHWKGYTRVPSFDQTLNSRHMRMLHFDHNQPKLYCIFKRGDIALFEIQIAYSAAQNIRWIKCYSYLCTKISYFQTKYSSLMYLLLQKELSVTILQYRCKYFTVVILFSLLLKKNYINQRIRFCSVTLKEINLLLQYLDHQQDCRSTQKCLITNKMFG